jgi:hypothetical protein
MTSFTRPLAVISGALKAEAHAAMARPGSGGPIGSPDAAVTTCSSARPVVLRRAATAGPATTGCPRSTGTSLRTRA